MQIGFGQDWRMDTNSSTDSVNRSLLLARLVAVLSAIAIGIVGFVAVMHTDNERTMLNEVAAAGLGIEQQVPIVASILASTAFGSLMFTHWSFQAARTFAVLSVSVCGMLLAVVGSLASYAEFIFLGVLILIVGLALNMWLVHAMNRQ